MGKSVKRVFKAVATGGLSEVASAVREPQKAAARAAQAQAAATRESARMAAQAARDQASQAQRQQETVVAQQRAQEQAQEILGEAQQEGDPTVAVGRETTAAKQKRRAAFTKSSSGINI